MQIIKLLLSYKSTQNFSYKYYNINWKYLSKICEANKRKKNKVVKNK